jgi:sugar lactone lactonase YvrE
MKRLGNFRSAGFVLALLTSLLNTSTSLSQPQSIITTYAGVSTIDGALASTQFIEPPTAVTSDGSGGFYFAAGRSRVFRVASDGRVTLVAGRGTAGFSGDGGPATIATLTQPKGLAVDSHGNLFIADWNNRRVRKVTSDGVISTVAGNGNADAGNLPNGDGGPATLANLTQPTSVAVDGNGNVFIADPTPGRIRKVTAGGIISTVAGTGHPGFSGDGGPATSAQIVATSVAVDTTGNLFISDTTRIRKVGIDGIITTVAGNGTAGVGGDGGPATLAPIFALGIAVDDHDNLFLADRDDNVVREVTSDGIIHTVAGTGMAGYGGDGGPAVAARLAEPLDVGVDGNGGLYIADSVNYRIRMVVATGTINTVAGTGPLSNLQFLDYPSGIAFDAHDNLFVARLGQFGILKFAPPGGPAIVGNSTGPASLVLDAGGDVFLIHSSPYLIDYTEETVIKLTPDGNLTSIGDNWYFFSYDSFNPAGEFCVAGIAVDQDGNLFVSETIRQTIWKVSPTGVKTLVAGTGNGTWGFSGDGGPATAAQLSFPNGITLDKNGNLFIADSWNNRIRKISSNGIISTIAGNGTAGFGGDGGPATAAQLWYPLGVAVDPAGNLFIADSHNNRIRRVSPDGTMTTVAGNGTFGFSGDGGPPASAQLDYPSAIAVDSKGNLFIADSGNNRIREVVINPPLKKRRGQLTSQ